MQEINELSRKTKDELRQIAQGLEISKTSAMKKEELVSAIIKKREEARASIKPEQKKRQRPDDVVEVTGVLDVMADGFGFLRFDNYRSGENDVYVSPTQIRSGRIRNVVLSRCVIDTCTVV